MKQWLSCLAVQDAKFSDRKEHWCFEYCKGFDIRYMYGE